MPQVNYITQVRAFQQTALKKNLSGNDFMLYMGLLEIFNKEARGADWPEGYLKLANSVVLAHTTFGAGDSGCRILSRARDNLKAHGLIAFIPGCRNTRMPQYRLKYFDSLEEANTKPAKTPAPTSDSGRFADKTDSKDDSKTDGKTVSKDDSKADSSLYHHLINQDLHADPNPGHTALAAQEQQQPAQAINHAASPLAMFEQPPKHLQFDRAWQTSHQVRGAVAQRLLHSFPGQANAPDALEALREVMQRGIPPDAILRAMDYREDTASLVALLKSLAHVKAHGQGRLQELLKPFGG